MLKKQLSFYNGQNIWKIISVDSQLIKSHE